MHPGLRNEEIRPRHFSRNCPVVPTPPIEWPSSQRFLYAVFRHLKSAMDSLFWSTNLCLCCTLLQYFNDCSPKRHFNIQWGESLIMFPLQHFTAEVWITQVKAWSPPTTARTPSELIQRLCKRQGGRWSWEGKAVHPGLGFCGPHALPTISELHKLKQSKQN